jgi:phosphate-selective porin
MNATDDNDNKDIAGRVWIKPMVAGLTLGGSLYHGKTNSTAAGAVKKDWDRWAADVEYRPAYIRGLLLRGEYLWARKYYATYASKNIIETTALPAFGKQAHSTGWYALAAYRVDGLKSYWRYLNGFEPVVRYDYFDEDTSTQTALSRQGSRNRTTIGLNYYLNRYSRLMANYEIIHADGSLKTSSLETVDTIGHHLFTTVFQVKF